MFTPSQNNDWLMQQPAYVFLHSPVQWTVSGCRGHPGPTVPAVVVVLELDIEVVSLLAMEARIAPSCLDLPWKSV